MKSALAYAGLAALALAAPSPLQERNFYCPGNPAQPNGQLPPGAVGTSLLAVISKNQPDKAFPPSNKAEVTPNDKCTIFNLELEPAQTQGKVCNLVFDFPAVGGPAPYAYWGLGHFTFTGYALGAGAVAGQTTWNRQPAPGPSPEQAPPRLVPGASYVVQSAPCPPLDPAQGPVTVSGSLCSPDTLFSFQQGAAACPMGFYVVYTNP